MASLSELIATPTLEPLLTYVTRPGIDPVVKRVALVEELGRVADVKPNALVLLTRGASAGAGSYRFDVALRMARSRQAAAFVISAADAGQVTPTASAIADRSGTAILATGEHVDLADLAVAVARELAGDAELALLRTHAALRAIEAHPANGDVQALIDRAAAALGVPLLLVEREPPDGPRAAVAIDGEPEGWLTAGTQDGDLAMGVDIVLHAAAAAVRQVLANARRADELPIASRAEVLTELLVAPPHGRPHLVQRARDLAMPIDGWHVAVRLDFEDLADPGSGPRAEQAAYEARLGVARAALQAVQAAGGTWHSARPAGDLLLIRMYGEDPGVAAPREIAQRMDVVLRSLRARLPATLIRCGVGSPHQGPVGLMSSAAEAKAAATAARTSGQAYAAVPFDTVGLRRALVEWYASDVAQDAVATVLAPLDELERTSAERLVKTLHVYLDNQGSLSRTAEVLSLHRNAVAYRVNKAFSLLDVDRDNPDDLLLLQLACRARDLS
jgi:hypothetical protein